VVAVAGGSQAGSERTSCQTQCQPPARAGPESQWASPIQAASQSGFLLRAALLSPRAAWSGSGPWCSHSIDEYGTGTTWLIWNSMRATICDRIASVRKLGNASGRASCQENSAMRFWCRMITMPRIKSKRVRKDRKGFLRAACSYGNSVFYNLCRIRIGFVCPNRSVCSSDSAFGTFGSNPGSCNRRIHARALPHRRTQRKIPHNAQAG
jgi:hypothetical protein